MVSDYLANAYKGSLLSGIFLALGLVISLLPSVINNHAFALNDWVTYVCEDYPDPIGTGGFGMVCRPFDSYPDPHEGLPGFPNLYDPILLAPNPARDRHLTHGQMMEAMGQKYGYFDCQPEANNYNCYYLDKWGRFERDLCKSSVDAVCKMLAASYCAPKAVAAGIPGALVEGPLCGTMVYEKCKGSAASPTDAVCENIVKSQRKLIASWPHP